MSTERPAAAPADDGGTLPTSGDGDSFCIEMDPDDSTTIYLDAPSSDRDSARQRLSELDSMDSAPSALGVITDRKWANGRTLTVCFFGGSATLQQSVQNCANEWTQFANIKFDFVEGRSADIRVAFTGHGGPSQSYVGTWNTTVDVLLPTMSLGLGDRSPANQIRRTTLHEFGHALGCVHEHSQPNVDIVWNTQAVIDAHRGVWDKKKVEHNIFRKYSHQQVQASAFDQFSIMLYPIPASWTNGFTSEWNNTLSQTDKAFISAMYPFPNQPAAVPLPQSPFTTPTPVAVPATTSLPRHASSGDIAAIKWANSPNEEIRVYFQKSDGYIYEGACSGNKWNSGDTKLVKAKLGTPITAFVFDTWNPIGIRFYYVNDGNRIAEHCWGQGWTPGAVLPSPSMSANTRLASCGWDDGDGSGAHINTYYQKSDGNLATISFSGSSGWTAGDNILEGYQASSMSANRLGGDIKVYCQGDDSSLASVRPSISVDTMKSYRVPGGTGISAVSWDSHQRVYFVDDYSGVYEMSNDGAGWITLPGQPTKAKASPRAKLAAVMRSTDPPKISVYFLQSGQDKFTEMAYDGRRWGLSKLPF